MKKINWKRRLTGRPSVKLKSSNQFWFKGKLISIEELKNIPWNDFHIENNKVGNKKGS